MRQVAVGERALVDFVADELGVASAHEVGDHVGADGGDEHHERRAHHAAADAGEEYLAEREETARAEVARGLQEGEVELLRRRVDRHDRERQEGVDAHHEDRAGVVVEHRVRRADAEGHEHVLEEPVGVQERSPGEHAHDEARPEREHDQPRHDRAPLRLHARDRVGAREGEDDAEERGGRRDPDRAPHDLLVGRAHDRVPRLHREARRVPAVRARRVERDPEHDDRGHHEEEREPRQRGQRDAPFGPLLAERPHEAAPFGAAEGVVWRSDSSSAEKFSTMYPSSGCHQQ